MMHAVLSAGQAWPKMKAEQLAEAFILQTVKRRVPTCQKLFQVPQLQMPAPVLKLSLQRL